MHLHVYIQLLAHIPKGFTVTHVTGNKSKNVSAQPPGRGNNAQGMVGSTDTSGRNCEEREKERKRKVVQFYYKGVHNRVLATF